MSEILRCENLTKRFGPKAALNDLSLTVESGKIIGLIENVVAPWRREKQ